MSISNCATFVTYANSSNTCAYVHLCARKLRAARFRFEEPKLVFSPSQPWQPMIALSATEVIQLKPSRHLKRSAHARGGVRRVDTGRESIVVVLDLRSKVVNMEGGLGMQGFCRMVGLKHEWIDTNVQT